MLVLETMYTKNLKAGNISMNQSLLHT